MRMVSVLKIAAITLLALLLVPLMAGIARAEGSQTWLLTDTAAGISAKDVLTIHVCDNIMCKDDEQPCGGMYLIGGAWVAWWYSEHYAECDVTFGEGDNWHVYLCVRAFGPGELQAQVWSVDESGNLESLLAEGKGTYDAKPETYGFQIVPITCNAKAQTVLKDCRLGLRVSSSGFPPLLYTCSQHCSHSQLHSPETDPGFPVPELPAIVLLAGGLGCLTGYMAWRRWRANANSTDGQHSQG